MPDEITVKQASDREAWAIRFIKRIAPWYEKQGYPLPKVRVGVGFPSTGKKSKRIGECWSPEASGDRTSEIFLHPGHATTMDIAGTIVHELVHAAVGNDKKHGPVFKRVAQALGLDGPMRATHSGQELEEKLKKIIADIGEFPHAQLSTSGTSSKGPRQKNRMLKASCPECGYIIRASKGCFLLGIPPCPNGDCGLSYKVNDHIIEMVLEVPLDMEEIIESEDQDS